MDDIKNSFWFGCSLKNFLFSDFDIDSYAGLLAVCCATASLVVVFEILKTSRIVNKMKTSASSKTSLFKLVFRKSTERSNLIDNQENGGCRHNREIWVVSDIFVHFLEIVIGYLLMLIVMTFNIYLMISICLGALIGYLLYGSVIFNLASQMATQRIMCIGCEIKPDGDLALIIDEQNEQGCSSETHHSSSEYNDPPVFTTAQIHDHS